ncbi:MAG TPA: thioesterase family protein [Acidimicrobiia bacterium]|nr:thioesterase family protein [Acidimicrobiia bacterium]
MPPELPDAVFHRDGDRYVPTALARGPWDPNAQHGGPSAALLARSVEEHEAASPAHVARMTIELLRPVPMQPIDVRARTVRPGKKVQLVESSVLADETEVVRATALRIRREDIPFADPPDDRLVPGPNEQLREHFENIGGLNFGFAMDVSLARGEVGVPGPAAVWFRLAVPIVAGEEPTPLMRVAAAADFGNGISGAVTWDEHLFINPDLTIYLHRLPFGPWVGLDAHTWPTHEGVGFADAALYDERGRIGRSVQALLLDRR